jgi:hypothetical protein
MTTKNTITIHIGIRNTRQNRMETSEIDGARPYIHHICPAV